MEEEKDDDGDENEVIEEGFVGDNLDDYLLNDDDEDDTKPIINLPKDSSTKPSMKDGYKTDKPTPIQLLNFHAAPEEEPSSPTEVSGGTFLNFGKITNKNSKPKLN